MQNTISKAVLIIGLAVGILTLSRADIPRQINIQGQLADSGGVLLNGIYSCVFNLYPQSSGGTSSYQESVSALTVQNGQFNYYLGSNANLNLSFGPTYWLGITLGTDSEMSPRTPIVSVGNAYKALNSDSANLATLAFTASTATTLTSAANIISGTLADSHLSNNVPLLNNYNTWSNSQTFNNYLGAGITNDTLCPFEVGGYFPNTLGILENGILMCMSTVSTNKRLVMGYDDYQDCGYIKAGRFGKAWTNLILQPGGGNVGIFNYCTVLQPTERLDIASGNIKLRDGNILMAAGYTVAGVDVSQQNATWIGSATTQNLTAATFYDVVTAVNNVNGGKTVNWSAPFTERPTVTTGILVNNNNYSQRYSYDVQWTYLSSTCGVFRVNYQDAGDGSSYEADSGTVTVMIHAIGK